MEQGCTHDVLFTTERLSCRRWREEDLADIYGVYSDEEGSRWVGDGKPITFEDAQRWIEVTHANYEQRGYGMFAVVDVVSEKTVGFCGLVHPGGQTETEIKYAFYRSCWGKGYASEVVPAMLSYALTEHGINHVIATVAEENAASQRVLTKSGMKKVDIVVEEDTRTYVYEWQHAP